MSVKQLVPLNNYVSASAPTIPTIRQGDLYYNTSTGLMVYDGASWSSVATSTLTEIDGGAFDGVAPYQGGYTPSIASTQTVNGGTP